MRPSPTAAISSRPSGQPNTPLVVSWGLPLEPGASPNKTQPVSAASAAYQTASAAYPRRFASPFGSFPS